MGYKISIIKAKGQCSKKVQLSAEHSISGPGHRDSRAECQLGIFAGGFRKIKKNKPSKKNKKKKTEICISQKASGIQSVTRISVTRNELRAPAIGISIGISISTNISARINSRQLRAKLGQGLWPTGFGHDTVMRFM